MPLVRLQVFELHPLIIEWMERINLWVPDFTSRAIKLKHKQHRCLCLEDQIFLEDALASKISAYLPEHEARNLLKIAACMGRVRVSPEKDVDHLIWLELVQRPRKCLIMPKPILLSPQVQCALKIQ